MKGSIQEEQTLNNLVRSAIKSEFATIEQKFSIINQALNHEDADAVQSMKEVVKKYINALEDKNPFKVKLSVFQSLPTCEEMIKIRDGLKILFIKDVKISKLSEQNIEHIGKIHKSFNSDIELLENHENCAVKSLNTNIHTLERCLLDQGILKNQDATLYANELLLTDEQDSCFEQI